MPRVQAVLLKSCREGVQAIATVVISAGERLPERPRDQPATLLAVTRGSGWCLGQGQAVGQAMGEQGLSGRRPAATAS